jgi:hypothetical protein
MYEVKRKEIRAKLDTFAFVSSFRDSNMETETSFGCYSLTSLLIFVYVRFFGSIILHVAGIL